MGRVRGKGHERGEEVVRGKGGGEGVKGWRLESTNKG